MRRRWALIGSYLVCQAAVLYLGWPLLDTPSTLGEYGQLLSELTYLRTALAFIALLTALQIVFVWPVRRPQAAQARGWPVRTSLAVAGIAIALLATALALAIGEGLTLVGIRLPDSPIRGDALLAAGLVLAWAVATPLLIAFCRRGPRESLLARVATAIFTGTIVETAAIIPLDVMVRRRNDCYCLAGTLWALIFCGSVGVFALGPAILLPLLARRRKRWYDGRCEVCGYDMRGTLSAERCPECGTGWKPCH